MTWVWGGGSEEAGPRGKGEGREKDEVSVRKKKKTCERKGRTGRR